MKNKSLKINVILNTVKVLLSVIFPLITFPYITRILHVENIGKVNFSNSIVCYFSLIASLGIYSYAIREGSRYRDDRKKFQVFASEVFSFNLCTTILAYLCLVISLICIPIFEKYKYLILIQSLIIVFTTIGIDWMNAIFEDFFYITIRTLIFQIVSLVLMFTFVKSEKDIYVYAFILVISNVGANILNFIHCRKYWAAKFTFHFNIKKHLKPTLLIFASSIAAVIYTSADTTMLGFMVGDYSVGLYSVSVKVYTIFKQVIFAMIVVCLPRLSFYISKREYDIYKLTVNKIYNVLTLLTIPMIVGINLLANEIILIISGQEYIDATMCLKILSISLLFAILAYFVMQSMLLPLKLEKYIIIGTAISAGANIISNIFLIPVFKENAAALTTLLSECLTFIITYFYASRKVRLKFFTNELISVVLGCISFSILIFLLRKLNLNMALFVPISIIGSAFIYGLVLLLLRNKFAMEVFEKTLRKVSKSL